MEAFVSITVAAWVVGLAAGWIHRISQVRR